MQVGLGCHSFFWGDDVDVDMNGWMGSGLWDMLFLLFFFCEFFHRTFGGEDSINITYHKYSAAVFLLKFTYVKCFCKRLTTPNMDHMLKIQHDLHPTGSTNEI